MHSQENRTITVSGRANLRLYPSKLILVGKVEVVGRTLQLAMGESEERKAAIRQWLERLGCDEVEFGQPRFPDQAEPDAHTHTRRHMSMVGALSRLAGREPEPDVNHRSVVYVYAACWNIEGMPPEETLVLADRIRFELAEDADEASEETEGSQFDPELQFQEMLASMGTESREDNTYMVFLTKLTDSHYRQLLEAAYDNATHKAVQIVDMLQTSLGKVSGFHILQDPLAREISRNFFRDHAAPILSESPLNPGPGEQISECPRAMDFELSASITFDQN